VARHKMRKILTAFLLLWLFAPRVYKASALGQTSDGAEPQTSQAPQKAGSFSESEDDIFSTTYERELLSRRFFQKTLPPLNRRQKIAWSFRTSRANILL